MTDQPVRPTADTDLTERLAHMESPHPRATATRAALRLALVDARLSSRVGVLLVAIPVLFLGGVVFRYGFGITIPGFSALENTISVVEHAGLFSVLSPLVLAGGPLVALALNLLAILHVERDRSQGELHIMVKLRPFNLLLIAVSIAILGMLFVHIVGERARHGV